MLNATLSLIVIVAIVAADLNADLVKIGDDDYDYNNDEGGVCKLSHNHKQFPSAEPRLDGQCRQWRSSSCCRPDLPLSSWVEKQRKKYSKKWNHSHCGEIGQTCLQAMYRQWCLYQCDPYLDPWIQLTNKTGQQTTPTMTAAGGDNVTDYDFGFNLTDDDLSALTDQWDSTSHRIFHVPLCRDDCNRWWGACKRELTCTNNWYEGFEWEMGTDGQWSNTCKNATHCKTIDKWFDSATQFCENIFPGDYKVAEEGDVCISFFHPEHNYNASHGNNSRSASPGLITTITIASISVVVLIFVAMIRSESIRAKLSNLSLQCLLWRDQLTVSSTVEVESLAQSDHLSREIHA